MGESEELGFLNAAKMLETDEKTARETMPSDFYEKLEKNKEAFKFATVEENVELRPAKRGRDSAVQVLRILRALRDFRQYTEDQEAYLKRVMNRLEEGALPKQTTSTVLKVLEKELKQGKPKPLKILALLQNNISDELLEGHIAESAAHTFGPREVILSEYLIGE